MMNNLSWKAITFLVICLTFGARTSAQVTIGAAIAPMPGTLLDLKQHTADESNITSQRGLQFPRVLLTSKTDLFPMFTADDADYMGDNKTKQDEAHSGLMVFNVNTVDDADEAKKLTPGLYVWAEKKWVPISFKHEESPDDIPKSMMKIVKLKTGNEYRTYNFGDAGEWMIDNLRETAYDTDVWDIVSNYGNPVEEIASEAKAYARLYYYPNGDKALFERHPEYGLLYSITAATGGQITERTDMGQNSLLSNVQGICPNGWVIPSRTDWRKLHNEIVAHPDLYTPLKLPENVSADYFASQIVRSPKNVEGANEMSDGESNKEGLDILLVGNIEDEQAHNYGHASKIWTSSANTDQIGHIRSYTNGDARYIEDTSNTSTSMNSVRCKKRETK